MPELPEVQTIISDLQSIINDSFTDFFSDFPKALKNLSVSEFTKEIKKQKIKSVSRLGKLILIGFNNGKNIAIHLKMTGQMLLIKKTDWKDRQKNNKYIRHVFFLKKNGVLAFSDVRKFGTISLLDDKTIAAIKNASGLDPIDEVFSLNQFLSILEKSNNKIIKEVLMNNSLILGIGNIYASEILFDARILPSRKTSSLTKDEAIQLHKSIKKILTKAIRLRGTSVSDYRDSAGRKGLFQKELKVYKRGGQKCKKCDTIILRSVIGQRSTFSCPRCQH